MYDIFLGLMDPGRIYFLGGREFFGFTVDEFSAPRHHPPMHPTKAIGAITQNRRGHPTATP
jgi:hypothetical protein